MVSKKIELLITKYLSRSISEEELDVLEIWILNPGNELIFKEYIRTHFAIGLTLGKPNIVEMRRHLQQEMQKEKTSSCKAPYISILQYAAMAGLFFILAYFLQNAFTDSAPHPSIVPNENSITLELNNGNIEVLSLVESSKAINQDGHVIGTLQDGKLIYEKNATKKESGYNILSVPKGKQFSLELSDGTQVILNAESSIKYPVAFSTKKSRKVFLTGEAFFEVAPDSHSPFIVNTQELDVLVHGTVFNVANYPENEAIEVVLLEGSVSMKEVANRSITENNTFLEPGYKGDFHKKERTLSKEKVNTALYTSWRQGDLVFRDLSFEKIIRKLERAYNIPIVNHNQKLARETFNATIETNHETLEQVFDYFNKVHRITYKVVENKIIIQ